MSSDRNQQANLSIDTGSSTLLDETKDEIAPMFDFTPDTRETASPRLLALELIARSSARLRLIASQLGGDAGMALICALRDMIIDAAVDPLHWPIDEAIALLRRPAPGRDA